PMHTISAYIDPASKQVVALGNYFQARGNAYKSKSLGMFACEIDKNGNINSRKLISWEKDVSKYLPINKKGKINSEGFLYFHNLVKSSDGNILAIGEQFRKGKAITLRTPTKDFSNKNSNALPQMVELENIYIFRFNPDFSLLDIKKFEKNIAYIS